MTRDGGLMEGIVALRVSLTAPGDSVCSRQAED